MNSELRKYSEHDDENSYGVYIPPQDDTWYQLKFDHDSTHLILIHYDRKQPLFKNSKENYREIRRILQKTTRFKDDLQPSIAYDILNRKLNNYTDLRRNRLNKSYKYIRRFKPQKDDKRDFSNIADYLKESGMPKSFANYFFHIENGELIIRPVVTRADIHEFNLDVKAMEQYLKSLKLAEEVSTFKINKKAGWYPNGKPPIFRKNMKLKK